MSEFTYFELKRARESAKVTQWQAANACGVSEDTLKRWEKGEARPTPEDVDNLGELFGDTSIWHKWMCSNHDSYRKRYIALENHQLTGAIVRNRYEMQDVMDLQSKVERGSTSGRIDDPALKAQYKKELTEMIAAARAVLDQL